MDIYFCDCCGARVTGDDLRRGAGLAKGEAVVCGECVEDGRAADLLATAAPAALEAAGRPDAEPPAKNPAEPDGSANEPVEPAAATPAGNAAPRRPGVASEHTATVVNKPATARPPAAGDSSAAPDDDVLEIEGGEDLSPSGPVRALPAGAGASDLEQAPVRHVDPEPTRPVSPAAVPRSKDSAQLSAMVTGFSALGGSGTAVARRHGEDTEAAGRRDIEAGPVASPTPASLAEAASGLRAAYSDLSDRVEPIDLDDETASRGVAVIGDQPEPEARVPSASPGRSPAIDVTAPARVAPESQRQIETMEIPLDVEDEEEAVRSDESDQESGSSKPRRRTSMRGRSSGSRRSPSRSGGGGSRGSRGGGGGGGPRSSGARPASGRGDRRGSRGDERGSSRQASSRRGGARGKSNNQTIFLISGASLALIIILGIVILATRQAPPEQTQEQGSDRLTNPALERRIDGAREQAGAAIRSNDLGQARSALQQIRSIQNEIQSFQDQHGGVNDPRVQAWYRGSGAAAMQSDIRTLTDQISKLEMQQR